jgi:hypothetical protein
LRHTVYRDIVVFQKDGDINERYPVEVEGNFGGIARTNWIYDSCRLMLAEVIELRCLKVVNASDGAFIPGAVPRVPEAIEPLGAAIDRGAMIEALKRSLNEITPASIFAETDLVAVARRADSMFVDLDALLEKLGRGAPDFAAAYRAMTSFMTEAGGRYGQADSIISGVLTALPRIAMFFGFRVADTALRAELFSLFIKEFRETTQKMREETGKLFARLATLATRSSEEREDRRRLA